MIITFSLLLKLQCSNAKFPTVILFSRKKLNRMLYLTGKNFITDN
uniref:Uncharacterized protein n=1 Tax=Heterorhabditis bacteriophora TaxID=37862 RepID=A0A1I7WV28_HETBA